ncbi:MAG: hypothetical protein V1658_01250 [Candidatus Micrarchaeota archaeon]
MEISELIFGCAQVEELPKELVWVGIFSAVAIIGIAVGNQMNNLVATLLDPSKWHVFPILGAAILGKLK